MYDDKSMEEEMRAIDYVRQNKFVYKALWSTAQIEHFIFFSIDSAGYFGARFGLRNPALEEFGIDSLIKHGHPNFQMIRQYRDPRTACTLSFEFNRIDNFTQSVWPRFRAQDKEGSKLACFSTAFISNYIFPLVQRIGDLHSLFDFLLADDEPTPWFVATPPARAAQAVALARQMGIEKDRIRNLLDPYKQMIAAHLTGKKIHRDKAAGYLDSYIDQLFSDLADQKRRLH